jgi:hypothetical protein
VTDGVILIIVAGSLVITISTRIFERNCSTHALGGCLISEGLALRISLSNDANQFIFLCDQPSQFVYLHRLIISATDA